MKTNFISIESVTGGVDDVITQDLKFKTGKFVWRVNFTAPLNPATVNSMNLYVTDIAGKPLKTAVRYDAIANQIEVEPLEAYAVDEFYYLNITKNVESVGGQKLKNEIRVQFAVNK
jgi:hypothetical protein